MVDLSRPDLPRPSAAIAEPTRHDPDQGGHFGVYGGRYVAEALMAVIEEVTAAYEKERVNPDFLDTLDSLLANYAGRPSPLYEATRLREHAGALRTLTSHLRPGGWAVLSVPLANSNGRLYQLGERLTKASSPAQASVKGQPLALTSLAAAGENAELRLLID